MDKVMIRNLLVRGIIGINPEERVNQQDILVNVVMLTDTRRAASSDEIQDAVNYRSVAKAIMAHVEHGEPMLVERLAHEIAGICLAADAKIEAVEITVEKPGAVRFAESVGVQIYRAREEFTNGESSHGR